MGENLSICWYIPRITPHRPIVHICSFSSILLRTTAEEVDEAAEKALVFGDIYEVGSCVQQHQYTKRIYRKRILLNLSLFSAVPLDPTLSLSLPIFFSLPPLSIACLSTMGPLIFPRSYRPMNLSWTHTIFLFKSLPFIQHKCFALCYRRCFWPFFARYSIGFQYFAFAGPFISICWIVCFNTWKMFMLL